MNRTIGEKIDSKKRKGESRRIKHTTSAHEDDACDDVKCALRTPNLSLEPRATLKCVVTQREKCDV